MEAGVLCRLEGEVTLRDFLPSLVEFDLAKVTLEERQTIPARVDLSAWIDDVVHDAAARTLTISWHDTGPAPLGKWRVSYLDQDIARGEGPPGASITKDAFDLAAASAEVIFASGGGQWAIPIRVMDLAALPTNPYLASLGLRELLALLGRRVSAERLGIVRASRGVQGVSLVLEAIFGEGFGPVDVFKAWWGVTEDLSSAPTVPAFRHRLIGPLGARTVWERLRDTERDLISDDEVWVYGCELLRQLERVQLAEGPDLLHKRVLLDEVIASLRRDLVALRPPDDSRPWLSAVCRFYGLGGLHAST